jgi:hypothetical protein
VDDLHGRIRQRLQAGDEGARIGRNPAAVSDGRKHGDLHMDSVRTKQRTRILIHVLKNVYDGSGVGENAVDSVGAKIREWLFIEQRRIHDSVLCPFCPAATVPTGIPRQPHGHSTLSHGRSPPSLTAAHGTPGRTVETAQEMPDPHAQTRKNRYKIRAFLQEMHQNRPIRTSLDTLFS